jgi:hypothetical protein
VEREIPLRLVLVAAPPGVDFGIQSGRGNDYTTLFVQQHQRSDIAFDFSLGVKFGKNNTPIFVGAIAQGPPAERFIYIDVGTYAGQKNTPWSRRMKIPLAGIGAPLIAAVEAEPGRRLATEVPGTAKDGGPNCATVKGLVWRVMQDPRGRAAGAQ